MTEENNIKVKYINRKKFLFSNNRIQFSDVNNRMLKSK